MLHKVAIFELYQNRDCSVRVPACVAIVSQGQTVKRVVYKAILVTETWSHFSKSMPIRFKVVGVCEEKHSTVNWSMRCVIITRTTLWKEQLRNIECTSCSNCYWMFRFCSYYSLAWTILYTLLDYWITMDGVTFRLTCTGSQNTEKNHYYRALTTRKHSCSSSILLT